jgi:hypothetical protein
MPPLLACMLLQFVALDGMIHGNQTGGGVSSCLFFFT